MRIKILFILMVVALSLTGCATNFANKDSASVASAVKVSSSKFNKGKSYIGPIISNNDLLSSEQIHLVRSIDGSEITTALLVDFLYTGGGWQFYESASFEGGDIKSLKYNRQVVGCGAGCSYIEETILVLPPEFLEKNKDRGFSIRYNSKNRTGVVVNLSSEYVRGFLSAIK